MKRAFLITLTIILFTGTVRDAKADFDPRMKALGIMAMYGTVGGTLLGTASLAFGTNGRSIAKGASLGLYAGLLFGGFVVISHAMNKKSEEAEEAPAKPEPPRKDYYPEEKESEYDEEDEGYGYEEEGEEYQDYPDDQSYRWSPGLHMDQISWRYESNHDGDRPLKVNTFEQPLVYFNLINVNF